MTNYEKIKQMNDVELAEFLAKRSCEHCNQGGSSYEYGCNGECLENITEWLNTQAEPSKQDTCLKCSQWKSGACRKPYDMPCKYDYEQLEAKVKKYLGNDYDED